jgi:hypothetical protein
MHHRGTEEDEKREFLDEGINIILSVSNFQ